MHLVAASGNKPIKGHREHQDVHTYKLDRATWPRTAMLGPLGSMAQQSNLIATLIQPSNLIYPL